MEVYDVVMIVVLIGATAFGAWKGLAWQVASLAAIFVSYFVAVEFGGQVAVHIKAKPPLNKFAAMLIIYVVTSLAIWVAFRWIRAFIDRLQLKEFDRQVGALLGLGKGVILCVIITMFAMALLGEEEKQAICHSRSGRYIAQLLDKAPAYMPKEIHDVVHPYLKSLDDQLDHPPHTGTPQPRSGGSMLAAGVSRRQPAVWIAQSR